MKVAETFITDNSRIVFSTEKFQGRFVASIRLFIDSHTYSGPTIKGITVSSEVLNRIAKVAKEIDVSGLRKSRKERVFTKIKINKFKSIVFHLSIFKGKPRIDLREYYTSDSYTGYGKKGVGAPIKKAGDFLKNLIELSEVVEAERAKLPQQGKLAIGKKIVKDDFKIEKQTLDVDAEITDEQREEVNKVVKKPQKTKKGKGEFSRFFTYFYEIFKHRASVADITDLYKAVDYFDLSEFLGEEALFSGKKDAIYFKLPSEELLEKIKKKEKLKDSKWDKQLEEALLQFTAFNKIKEIFLTYQEKSYEVELYVGFPTLSFVPSKEDQKRLFAPLFIAKAEISYDVFKNYFKLTLISDNFQLNLALAGKLTAVLGKDYVQDKLLEAKPNLPLEEKSYRTFIKLLRDLLELNIGTLPKSLKIDPRSIGKIFKDKDKYNISNKSVVFLARRGDFYILDDLHKLSEKDEEIGDTILSKFFSHDVYSPKEEKFNNKHFLLKAHLFPFASNSEQRRIVEHSSQPLVLVEGPPGTGKSQTISNLICHLVAGGKRVLVTSQKNKALEVIDQKIDGVGIQYLQMTLLKNDTKAKKLLIEKINDLDFYLRDKAELKTKTKIDRLQQVYQSLGKQINDLNVLFQRTLTSEEENTELYKKYSKIRHLDLIVDNVTSLEKKGLSKFKEKFLKLVSLYQQSLDKEEEILILINLSKATPERLKEVLYHLEKLDKLRTAKKEALKTKGLKNIDENLFDDSFSVAKVDTLLKASHELVNFAQKYKIAKESLTNVTDKKIDQMAQNFVSGDLTYQVGIVDKLKKHIPHLKANKNFVDIIDSEISLSELERMRETVKSLLKKSNFPYSLGVFKKVLLLKHRKYIKHTEVIKNLHLEELIELNKGIEYWISYKMTEKLSKRFIYPEPINNLLKSDKWIVEKEIERIENIVVAVHAKWYINKTIKARFGLSKEECAVLIHKFKSILELALKLESFFVIKKTDLELSALSIKLEMLLQDYYKEIKDQLIMSGKKDFENLQNLFQKVYLYLLSRELGKELNAFRETINNLRESVKTKDNLHKTFVEKIDKVFECELLDNKIKKLEKEFPLSTQDITEKVMALKKKRVEIINELIQASIDRNLIGNYQKDPKIQRELAYFRKQLRRSKKSYSTFDEMKKEFDFSSLLSIFPCWIMGIDDVSRIFPLISGLFDYVIFDEASQCNLSSSIPALYRGKRSIVVGDDKQLSDFTRMWIQPKYNDLLIKNLRLKEISKFDALDARYNSLFDTCSVFKDRKSLLTEHFRSYPEIINFSNQEFYNNKLRIMTNSLSNELGKILNVVMVKGARENEIKINEVEAQEIIKKLKKLVSDPKYQQKTIGVLSLFREQANYIHKLIFDDDELRTKIQDHKIITDTVDGFQGDERDVILYSFRYASNSNPGIFNFTRTESGWRRVNVAFTRPREQVFSFVSRKIDEFPAGFVKEFLQYSKEGQLEESKIEKEFDSDFERDVYRELARHKDFTTLPQFKTCGFRIDFVVLKDNKSLALECDGMFHYDKHGSLIEEDIERQDILERAGWNVRRLTSREFYRNPEESVRNILKSYFKSI